LLAWYGNFSAANRRKPFERITRKHGCVTYSRQGIRLYRDTLRKVLDERGFLSTDKDGQRTYALADDMPAKK